MKMCSMGADYVSPLCKEIAMMLDGSVLTMSGLLDDLDDNSIYTEEF